MNEIYILLFAILFVAAFVWAHKKDREDWKDYKESELNSKTRYKITDKLDSELKESEQNIFMN